MMLKSIKNKSKKNTNSFRNNNGKYFLIICVTTLLGTSYISLSLSPSFVLADRYVTTLHQQQQQPSQIFQGVQNIPNQPCDRTRKIFTEPYGEFSDGPSRTNYTQDSHCEWLIRAKNDSQFITLTFHSMGTECSYDYIYVYDGDSFNSTLLGSFSGKTEPQFLVATSGSMLILLYSDTNYVLEGFKASYYISNCLNNCHNHGKCIGHECVCLGEWVGPDCEDEACPDKCGESSGRGKCIKGMCRCEENYSGRLCDLHIDPEGGHWRWLATDAEGLTPRAAHTGIYIEENDSLYVFGGYDLNEVVDSLQIYRFNSSRWEDEWGIPIQNRKIYHPQKIDNTLLKAVLSNKDDEEAKLWGLNSKVSYFRSILHTLAESNLDYKGHKSSSSINVTQDDIVEIIDDILENVTDTKPSGRYGHAAENVPDGFVIFGGKLSNGSLSNELWMYNITDNGGRWSLRATNSTFKPPPLTRHTLTRARNYLYVFGGSLSNGKFSSRVFRIKLLSKIGEEQWEEIKPRGGKTLDVRLVAHTTVYYCYTNSLIVYGGIMTNVARFSKLSDRIFAFQLDKLHWTEIIYPRSYFPSTYFPRERAFHTATIVGNYLIIFGGYTHRHNKEEICYDNQMYLYHLGCHTWIKEDVLSGGFQYPKKQGVFAHAAAIRRNNTLLIVGGYHGNVNADLFAYELPQIFRVKDPDNYNPEEACRFHTTHTACLLDPECGWCSADSSCYGRTIGANCTTNLQTTRCPGICPSLSDCHSCLIHGASWSSNSQSHSIANKLGLNQCTWCVQNARCHHKADNYGVCGEETPTQFPGWWGAKGTEIFKPEQCTSLDRRPGLTYIKYHYPVNWTMPDMVSITNSTTVDFASIPTTTHTEHEFNGEMIARLLGFIRPSKSNMEAMNEMLHVCTSFSSSILQMGKEDTKFLKATSVVLNMTTSQFLCNFIDWPNTTEKFAIDFQTKRRIGIGSYNNQFQKTKMELQQYHHGIWKPFTFEYLEPFSDGHCSQYTNCLHCLTDTSCGWCDLTNKCIDRNANETSECSDGNENWKYFMIQPTHCLNCSNLIDCNQCVDTGLCEWWTEDAKCARIGKSANAVRKMNHCPTPCQQRKSCSDCLDEKGRCVWCEATSECFSFSVYTSEYQFGICREWIDQAVSLAAPSNDQNLVNEPVIQQCKSCSQLKNCSSCLRTLGCGWCFDRDNPIEGLCMRGDFTNSFEDCEVALNTTAGESEWAYAQCPDVDECGLGLHDCHREAKCTNTHGSYNCYCRKGYIGDGRISCVKTCNETCVHGYCSGSPDYICKCDLGWTGPDCSVNCGCNNHSTCVEKVGKCDKCQNWTEGGSCEKCRPGSYGNATSDEGCKPCECNGHGNQELGICDVRTGECFCKDNTSGSKCENCNKEYYGDPQDGGMCYFQCESRGLLKNTGRQGIGSYQSYKNPWGGPEVRECLWLISPQISNETSGKNQQILQINVEKQNLNVFCEKNAVYVYDGLPDLTGNTQQNQLLAVICAPYSALRTIEVQSNHLTVHYKQRGEGYGFNAIYTVKSCTSHTCYPPHICDENNRCVCPKGFVGSKCELEICPGNCTAHRQQGYCDINYGRCICNPGYAGLDCKTKIKQQHLVVTELFNTLLLNENYEHLRKTIPRFGHSLNADKRGSLWMFGGYSLTNGPLNDIRQFDTKNSTWMQVTVDSTPEAKMPQGRYFHAADVFLSKQTIYIHGGLTNRGKGQPNEILGDFWQFSIQNQRWNEITMNKTNSPPPLIGHTLTYIKIAEKESLILIGGSTLNTTNKLHLWEYNLNSKTWKKLVAGGTRMTEIFGHSTVYHASSQIIYVFGGLMLSGSSNTLYALNIQKLYWTELPPFKELNRPESLLPRSRFFHSATTTDNYMVIYGGLTTPYNASDILIAYIYDCNEWIRLTEDIEIIGRLPDHSYAEAITMDPENKAIYVVGGWDGTSQSQVIKFILPEDICQFWSSGKYYCRHYMGCSYCSVSSYDESTSSYCFSSWNSQVCEVHNGSVSFNNGRTCDESWIMRRNCSSFTTCSSCLASWPSYTETTPTCQWCDGCGIHGRCIPAGADCNRESKWCNKQTTVGVLSQCPQPQCHTLNCEACFNTENCQWAVNDVGLTECITKDLIERNEYKVINNCPKKCHTFTNCSVCLENEKENPKHCKWSTSLNACISPDNMVLYCAGGACGLVLNEHESEYCPEPCLAYKQCSTCLRHAHCGWCSRDSENGDGICTEGSLESLSEYPEMPASLTCDTIYSLRRNITLSTKEKFSWNYVNCPPENECENGHHNCNSKSEKCVDSQIGYECKCGEGYKEKDGDCVPVCMQGCVRGTCVEPNNCECDFGYVGANCSIQCQCNGHSNCGGPDKLTDCLKCHNNTMGAQCEKCQPLFVRNDNGHCIPCLEYCNGHSELCVISDYEDLVKNMSKSEIEAFVLEGPSSNAVCLRCANQTTGYRCQNCITGYFRGSNNQRDVCRPCECHGHGDICDPVTGEKCNCGNNTESDATCSASSSKNSAQLCWMVQCSKCRDSYAGNPIDGHQCYKQITVESRMCFDAKPIEECKVKPSPLRPGQTVFFVIQPRFMNVDIRIIIDVTQGELDVFMSPQDDSFIVLTNQTTGEHQLYLDNRYRWVTEIDSDLTEPLNIAPSKYEPNNSTGHTTREKEEKIFWTPHIHDCTSLGGTGFYVRDEKAKGLSTYITLNQCNTLLRLFGLKNRLVLTLPQNAHNLSATRFFITLRASSGSDQCYGSIVFRQDQLHIDLFVFFSVFFSCFFLFLAICVVAWKAKQAADLRRARRRHVVEMLHMAQRPFAIVYISLNPECDTPVQIRRRGRSKPSILSAGDVRPIAIEPTADNIAAVGTVFISLPGKYKAPVTLALGSALIVMPRQLPLTGRAFLRRRGGYQNQDQQQSPQQQAVLPPPTAALQENYD